MVGKTVERTGEGTLWDLKYREGVALEERFPQVEAVVRTTYAEDVEVGIDKTDHQGEAVYAEARFFDVFTFPLAQGDPARVLAEPNAAVLTPEAARTYFGTSENLVGRTLSVDASGEEQRTFTVTGVTEPMPQNTRFSFDLLLSAKTGDMTRTGSRTFALLHTPEAVRALREIEPVEIDMRKSHTPVFIPLPDLYLSDFTEQPGFRGDPRYLYLFSAIAAFILLIASINYANLATARVAWRAREVGVRKTMGATRLQVARQFLGESVLLTVAALAVALALAWLALPAFGTAAPKGDCHSEDLRRVGVADRRAAFERAPAARGRRLRRGGARGVVWDEAVARRLRLPHRLEPVALRRGGPRRASRGDGRNELASPPRRTHQPGSGAEGRVSRPRVAAGKLPVLSRRKRFPKKRFSK